MAAFFNIFQTIRYCHSVSFRLHILMTDTGSDFAPLRDAKNIAHRAISAPPLRQGAARWATLRLCSKRTRHDTREETIAASFLRFRVDETPQYSQRRAKMACRAATSSRTAPNDFVRGFVGFIAVATPAPRKPRRCCTPHE